jgi:adenosylcobinamide kinase/adenosylcobinamide-phosphate guanylyltransferase
MNALIIGGTRSGKSMLAQRKAQQLWEQSGRAGTLWYAATMQPSDDESRERVQKHVQARAGWGFQTLEVPFGFSDLSQFRPQDVILLDSVTLLLCSHLYGGGHPEQIAESLHQAAKAVQHLILVSDDTFSDACFYEESVEQYRRCLGFLHRQIAEWSDFVLECRFGTTLFWKGSAERWGKEGKE